MHTRLTPLAAPPQRTMLRSLKRRLPIQLSVDEAHFRIHDPASFIRYKLGRSVYEKFHSFAVVRNPFDHAVSHFEYLKQYRSEKIARQFESIDFLSYLKMRERRRFPWQRIFIHLPDQSYFLVDKKKKLIVDRIIKFETLNKDVSDLMEFLNLEPEPLEKLNFTKSKKGKKTQLLDYFGSEETNLVRKIYQRDFAHFGYSLDVPTA